MLRKLHRIHHTKHPHVVVGHVMELAAALASILRVGEILVGGFALAGATILLIGLFVAEE